MSHLPPTEWGDVATKHDLTALEERLNLRIMSSELRLIARIERSARGFVVWTSGMVLATGGLAFAAGRLV